MSRYFPHTTYAEDQPLSRAILTTHVLTRGAQAGAGVGGVIFSLSEGIRYLRSRPAPSAPAAIRLLRSAGTGTAIAMVLMAAGLPARRFEDIQWKDRAWRLMENKGQLETDDWTYAAVVGSVAGLAVRRDLWRPLGARGALGVMGMGSVVGALGYMGWRYGVKGGKFEEDDKKQEAAT